MVIKILLLYCMIFCHIVDDYYLQGILASMKQRKWWEEHAPQSMYRYDYIVALIMHGFSWSFMVHVPLLVYGFVNNSPIIISCLFLIPIHAIVHAIIDNYKANDLDINLIIDQILHMIQILCIWGSAFRIF